MKEVVRCTGNLFLFVGLLGIHLASKQEKRLLLKQVDQ